MRRTGTLEHAERIWDKGPRERRLLGRGRTERNLLGVGMRGEEKAECLGRKTRNR